MAANSKKIINVSSYANLAGVSGADPNAIQEGTAALLAALAARFPQFQFRLDGSDVFADGEAWAKKASERPAMGTMMEYAEGYLQCLLDQVELNPTL